MHIVVLGGKRFLGEYVDDLLCLENGMPLSENGIEARLRGRTDLVLGLVVTRVQTKWHAQVGSIVGGEHTRCMYAQRLRTVQVSKHSRRVDD